MAYPTGNTAQTDAATVTLTVPVKFDDEANDFILDALTASLIALTFPSAWNAANHTISADDAAVYAQAMLDSMVVTWP